MLMSHITRLAYPSDLPDPRDETQKASQYKEKARFAMMSHRQQFTGVQSRDALG